MKETVSSNVEVPLQMNRMPFEAKLAEGLDRLRNGDISGGFTTFGKGAVEYFSSAGWTPQEMSDGLAMLAEAEVRFNQQKRKETSFIPSKPYSMVATQKKASEIREVITLMNNYLMCNEIIFCDLEQKYTFRILDMLEEKGLYRHQMKKHANRLRELTGTLQMRIRDNDRMSTWRSSGLIMPSNRYADSMYEQMGGIASKLQVAFLEMFDIKLKLIRLDSRELVRKMNLKHTDLLSEVFTMLALTETAIELFAFCQKQIRIAGRGRLIDHTIKSTHHESVRNAVKGLLDQFVSRGTDVPKEEALRAREHVKEFQQELVKDGMFEMFNAQYMSLRMDYIEFYLASARMEIENGTVGRGLIREVWKRLGTRQAAKSFFRQLAGIPLPQDDDVNEADVAHAISQWEGRVKTVDLFRRLCLEGKFGEGEKETDEQFRCRVLRTVARKFKGQLPDDVLATLVKAHGTKKAVVEQLEKAGFELAPTLRKVRKMKAAELKSLKETIKDIAS